ncbi:hypothetical protein [Ammoniphilus resinae]|uniref:hypothetical protein n=1 Tax=Ammoniphilus resinae TaxID=861532 RepID=UPI001AEB3080|nr:hypothetical protein [Ammoniphilus resinae]
MKSQSVYYRSIYHVSAFAGGSSWNYEKEEFIVIKETYVRLRKATTFRSEGSGSFSEVKRDSGL